MKKPIYFFLVLFLATAFISSCQAGKTHNVSKVIVKIIQVDTMKRAQTSEPVAQSTEGLFLISKSEIKDKKIMVTAHDGSVTEYKIRGISYSPDIDGKVYLQDYKNDLPLISALSVNSIRTFRPFGAPVDDESYYANTLTVLDACVREGITVAVGFSYDDMAQGGEMENYLNNFGNHPAILMIVFGNEYNYHYGDWFSKEDWFARIACAMEIVKKYTPDRIVATVHGEMPSQQEYDEYVAAGFDLIMMNLYRGPNFGFAKDEWSKLTTTMPWIVSEFGRGSKDGNGNDTSKIQASYLQTLIRSMDQGYLFTFIDDPEKGADEVDPNIGAEDSMGVYDVDRNPKLGAETVHYEYLDKKNAK